MPALFQKLKQLLFGFVVHRAATQMFGFCSFIFYSFCWLNRAIMKQLLINNMKCTLFLIKHLQIDSLQLPSKVISTIKLLIMKERSVSNIFLCCINLTFHTIGN